VASQRTTATAATKQIAPTRWISERRWTAAVFLLVPVLYFMVVTGPVGYGRYRIPIMPLLAVLAGLGVNALLARRSATRQSRLSGMS